MHNTFFIFVLTLLTHLYTKQFLIVHEKCFVIQLLLNTRKEITCVLHKKVVTFPFGSLESFLWITGLIQSSLAEWFICTLSIEQCYYI